MVRRPIIFYVLILFSLWMYHDSVLTYCIVCASSYRFFYVVMCMRFAL